MQRMKLLDFQIVNQDEVVALLIDSQSHKTHFSCFGFLKKRNDDSKIAVKAIKESLEAEELLQLTEIAKTEI